MSFKEHVRRIARQEAQDTVIALLSAINTKNDCANLGVVTAVDYPNNQATVVVKDGSIVIATISGNKSIGVGVVVPMVGNLII